VRRGEGGVDRTIGSEVVNMQFGAAHRGRDATFLQGADGSENGSRVSCSMAGVATSDSVEIGFDTQISASNQTLTSLRWRISTMRCTMKSNMSSRYRATPTSFWRGLSAE
jgi:hypothetical protein